MSNLVTAKSPGAGASFEIALEFRRTLIQAEFLAAGGVNDYGTLLGNASVGAVLRDANYAPYVRNPQTGWTRCNRRPFGIGAQGGIEPPTRGFSVR